MMMMMMFVWKSNKSLVVERALANACFVAKHHKFWQIELQLRNYAFVQKRASNSNNSGFKCL